MVREGNSRGEEGACGKQGGLELRALMEKGSLDGGQGSLGRLEETQGS